jgi:hypothetical protein
MVSDSRSVIVLAATIYGQAESAAHTPAKFTH